MAVTLRLARYGVPGKPFYRLVASQHGAKRDGKFLEILGTVYPMVNPPKVALKEDRIRYWVENGAELTSVVRDVLRHNIKGYIEAREEHRLKKIQAARKARKARAKGGKTAKAAKKK